MDRVFRDDGDDKLRLPCGHNVRIDEWRVRLPLPPNAFRPLNNPISLLRAEPPPVIRRSLPPVPPTSSLSVPVLASASASTSAAQTASASAQVPSSSDLGSHSDLPRRARELAENAARCALVAPGSARRSVATLLQAAAAAEDEVLSPEQLTKLTKRVLNRASVQKCRRKQRERALRLEGERAALGRENALLHDVKRYVEACGALNMVRDARGMRWRQRQ